MLRVREGEVTLLLKIVVIVLIVLMFADLHEGKK